MDVPFRVAIIGLGGFAQAHHRAVAKLEARGLCRLVATCDIDPDTCAQFQAEMKLADRGVPVYDDYRKMLDAHDHLDLVTIPTPIPLHVSMHRDCVHRGIPVYLEKPPTLDYRELAAMLDEERTAPKSTYVGFNFIVQPERRALKQRLVDGEFGELKTVAVRGCWPRSNLYFTRNNWAGRLRWGHQLVLDSVMGNAMSHYVHNALFWCGAHSLNSWGEPASVVAEAYRANPIEGLDTVFCRARIVNGPELRISLTHACLPPDTACDEYFVTDDATVRFGVDGGVIEWNDGRREDLPVESRDLVAANIAADLRYLAGELPRPTTMLADCEPFVHLNDLVYVSANGIADIDAEHRQTAVGDDDAVHIGIPGIAEVGRTFCALGRFPSRQDCPWACPGSEVTPADLPRLAAVIDRICPRK